MTPLGAPHPRSGGRWQSSSPRRGSGGAEEEVCGQDGILVGEDNIICWDRLALGEVQQVGKCLVWRGQKRVPSVLRGVSSVLQLHSVGVLML
jgi:hypothetical protein